MMLSLRTTVTLDPDVESLVNAAMRQKGLSFKEAINDAIRAGLGRKTKTRFRQRTYAMGVRPEINYDKALEIAAAVETQEQLHKMALGK